MKNIVLSAVAVLAMSSFAVAGGDIAPVEEPVVVVEPVMDDSGFYIGAAYGYLTNEVEYNGPVATPNGYADGSITLMDDSHNEFMIDAGYKFNSYVAIEGRYWFGADTTYDIGGETYDIGMDAWGIYVKPMYPVTDAFDIYALLGYASSEATVSQRFAHNGYEEWNSDSFDGFSWGIGAEYSFTDNVSLFVDYTSLYSDEETVEFRLHSPQGQLLAEADLDTTISTWNFGINYKF